MPVPKNFTEVIETLKGLGHCPSLALACAADEAALSAVCEAESEGIIKYQLFGEKAHILEVARRSGVNVDEDRIREVEDEAETCSVAVKAVVDGEADILMKGHVHTATFLRAVLSRNAGLRGEEAMSHVFIWDAPHIDRLIFVTDGALNVAPDLDTKIAIVKNAVRCAQSFGIEDPKVALFAAVEVVNPKMPATIDAAIITQMARRGQLGIRAQVDGPLALDNAVSLEAARVKEIDSPVAGRADILVAPDIEAGNILAKACPFLVPDGEAAGIIVGARVPVVITSRADSAKSKLYSIVAAVFAAAHERG